jgi:hypothetical protein
VASGVVVPILYCSYVYTDRWAIMLKPPNYPRLACSLGVRIEVNAVGILGILQVTGAGGGRWSRVWEDLPVARERNRGGDLIALFGVIKTVFRGI